MVASSPSEPSGGGGEEYIPAAHWHLLTPLYEPLTRWFNGRVWDRLAAHVAARAPRQGVVADLGCGSGALLRQLRALRPDLELIGYDIDPPIIRQARRRARGLRVEFGVCPIQQVPLLDGSVDVLLSCLMFHHLPRPVKEETFAEARRLLKPGGEFLLCDFSEPVNAPWWQPLWFFRHMEPELIPQFDGELNELGALADTAERPFSVYRFIGCHRYAWDDE